MGDLAKYSIFHIEGGIGKHVAATAVAKCIKNNYPDRELIVVCAYPSIFLNLDFVDKVYRHGNTPYFYQTYIKSNNEPVDSLLFKHEPYFTTEHIHQQTNLIENWCKLYQLDYTGEKPVLIFNMREKQLSSNLWRSNKPILLIQTSGGVFGGENQQAYKWTRDMPPQLAQKIAHNFIDQYDIMQVTRPGAVTIPGATVIDKPMIPMELLTVLLASKKRLLIDSVLQHGAAALDLPSTVLWIGTNPTIFGYDIHDNIKANPPKNFKLPDSYLYDFNFEGSVHECPYKNESEIFDKEKEEEIINSIKRQGL